MRRRKISCTTTRPDALNTRSFPGIFSERKLAISRPRSLLCSGRSTRPASPRELVYLLRCSDGSLYTGVTNDLRNRLKAYSTGKASKYTRSRLPVKLVCSEPKRSKSALHKGEAAIKKLRRAEKEQLVASGRQSLVPISAVRATLSLSSVAYGRSPAMLRIESALPPIPVTGTGHDILRRNLAVSSRMPLRCNLGKTDGEVVGFARPLTSTKRASSTNCRRTVTNRSPPLMIHAFRTTPVRHTTRPRNNAIWCHAPISFAIPLGCDFRKPRSQRVCWAYALIDAVRAFPSNSTRDTACP
jgi:putative endonuclease